MSQAMDDREIVDCNQQGIKELIRAIELSRNNFSMILIHCNYEFLQNKVVQQIQECCTFYILPVWLTKTLTTLHTEMHNQLGEQGTQSMFVSGLSQVNNLDQVLSSSNYIREEFRNSFPFPILLWVTDTVLKKWIQLAPDLESWTTTFKFEASKDELIFILQEYTEHIYKKVLDIGAHGFIPQDLVLDSKLHLEVESAVRELNDRLIPLPPILEARVKFVLGLNAFSNRHMETALAHFEQSLKFWQENHRLKHQGCVFYYLGLWWRKQAALKKSEASEYDQACEQAERYFRQCVKVFEQAQRPDLVAKFINALGETLHRRRSWKELEVIAPKAIQLHQTYPDLVRLAYAYALLAEAKTEAQFPNWAEIKQIAGQALGTLDQFEDSLASETLSTEDIFLSERLRHRGWYSLIFATALKHLGEVEEAVAHLERAQKNGAQLTYHLYHKILEILKELYFESKNYQKAFQIRRKQYSIQQQYGLRAFVGAGYLQPSKTPDWASPDLDKLPQNSILASEIQASGRYHDVEILAQKIRSPRYKLLTIYGPPGVGKSSLINAGLIPELEQQQGIRGKKILSPIPVLRKYNDKRWLKDLGSLLKKSIEKQGFSSFYNLDSPESILETLKNIHRLDFVTILIFDQFEDFFFASNDRSRREIFYQFLGKLLEVASVKVVISIREDCLHYLLECNRSAPLKAISNDILSRDFLYFLGNLSVEDAKSLIQALTNRTQVKLGSDLIEALVEDLASELGEVRPIELQLVGAQLEEERMITLNRYKIPGSDAQGRIRKLIQSWLNRVIKECGAENEDTAWKVLHQLTHREKIRTIKTRNELMGASLEKKNRLRVRQIKCILEVLEGSGVVSKLREDSKDYYQLAHDYLMPYIQDEYARHFDEVGQVVRKLKQQLTQNDLVLKLDATIQMGEMAAFQAVKPLKQLLERSDNAVSLRWHIFKALAQIKGDEAIELLIKKGLEDPEPAIQAHTAHLLGQLQPKLSQFQCNQAVEKLLLKCRNDHRCIRVQARWAVKQLNLEPPEFEEKANPLLAYILMKGNPVTSDQDDYSRIEHLRSLRLRDTCGVIECGITCGNYDFLIKVLAENIESLNELVMGMIPHLSWVKLTRTFVVVSEPRLYYWCRTRSSQAHKYISYVWIETSGLNSDSLISCLMDIPEVSEAATIYGGFDVIAKIEANEPTLRDIVLTQKIARLPFVNSTITYPVIMNDKRSHWDNSEEFRFPREWLIE